MKRTKTIIIALILSCYCNVGRCEELYGYSPYEWALEKRELHPDAKNAEDGLCADKIIREDRSIDTTIDTEKEQECEAKKIYARNLANVDFTNKNLSPKPNTKRGFAKANLAGANLTGTILKGTDLKGATLTGAYHIEAGTKIIVTKEWLQQKGAKVDSETLF